jgi:Phage terminase large subunit
MAEGPTWQISEQPPEVFRPLYAHLAPNGPRRQRFRGLSGGRGSGKSHALGLALLLDMTAGHVRAVCAREVWSSIKDSSYALLVAKIRALGGERFFKITDHEIVYGPNESLVIFRGLQASTGQAAGIRSLENFDWFCSCIGRQSPAARHPSCRSRRSPRARRPTSGPHGWCADPRSSARPEGR